MPFADKREDPLQAVHQQPCNAEVQHLRGNILKKRQMQTVVQQALTTMATRQLVRLLFRKRT